MARTKSLLKKLSRDFKKRPIAKIVAKWVKPPTYRFKDVELQPFAMANEVYLTPWDMEKDPAHEKRAVGYMLQQFIKSIGPSHLAVKTEVSADGTKRIRANLILMIPTAVNATWYDYNTAPVIVNGVARMAADFDAERFMRDNMDKKDRNIWRGENENRIDITPVKRGGNTYDPENFL